MSGHLRFGIGEEFACFGLLFFTFFLSEFHTNFIYLFRMSVCTLLFLLTAGSIAEDRGVVLGYG